jgi:hypothetical protein
LEARGFSVTYQEKGVPFSVIDANDLVIYPMFSRPFRPRGFLDFHTGEAAKLAWALQYGAEKVIAVSFGSPYFGEQYLERAPAYVNAYSMLAPSVKAFVRAATGEIPFTNFSPVHLTSYEEETQPYNPAFPVR